jgi:hypothetical protein
MSTVITKSKLYQFLFVLCVIIPYFDNFELTFFIWGITALLTLQNNYSYDILKQVICFSGILCLAIVVSFFEEHQTYKIFRDATYIIKPVLGLLIGYQICKKNYQFAFQTIAYTGVIIALYHFLLLFLATLVFKAYSVNDIRFYAGYFSDFEVYALLILIFRKKLGLNLPRKKAIFFILLISVSVFMYLARTNFIQFAILFMALKGYFKINKRSITVVSSIIILAVIGYSTILYINPKRNGEGIEALLYKIKIAPTEPFKTKINRDSWKDFNDNYRSYENIMTVRTMTRDGGLTTLLFGKGIGSEIDLRQKVWLGDMELRYISILHNGYMTVFLKSGLLGVLLLVLSIFFLFKKVKSDDPVINHVTMLMIGSGIFMIVSYWVFMGYYFKADNKSILIGFLICYREIALKTGRANSNVAE